MVPKIFVKVSGDLFQSPGFLEAIAGLGESELVICVGGGSQINTALEKLGIERKSHGPLGRELPTAELRQIAWDELRKNQANLEKALAQRRVTAKVIVPVLEIGGVVCHINGDLMVKTAYLGFDHLIVVTTPDRLDTKKRIFAGLAKIEILAI